jgi:hypothetical protein
VDSWALTQRSWTAATSVTPPTRPLVLKSDQAHRQERHRHRPGPGDLRLPDAAQPGRLQLRRHPSADPPRIETVTSETGADHHRPSPTRSAYAARTCRPPRTTTPRAATRPTGTSTARPNPSLDWFHKYRVTGGPLLRPDRPEGRRARLQLLRSGLALQRRPDHPLRRAHLVHLARLRQGHPHHRRLRRHPVQDGVALPAGHERRQAEGRHDAFRLRRRHRLHRPGRGRPSPTATRTPALREQITYNGDAEVTVTVNDPWSKKTATQHKSYADIEAYYVRTGSPTPTPTSPPRRSGAPAPPTTTTTTTACPPRSTTRARPPSRGDETCTRTWYARNDTLGINSLVSRTRTVGQDLLVAETRA